MVLQGLKSMAVQHLHFSSINEDGFKDFRILISILLYMRTESFPAVSKCCVESAQINFSDAMFVSLMSVAKPALISNG